MKSDLNLDLVQKYNVPGPRYTSYPTALQFEDLDNSADLKKYLTNQQAAPKKISLYFHIPFCYSLCWYCGCTKVISRNTGTGDVYLEYLNKEMKQAKEWIHPESKVVQIHFGGGTPTFLKPEQLDRLGSFIHKYFNITSRTEFGVEIDPRRCTVDHIKALHNMGCNRASIGVQDTNEKVQEAIHRIQPMEMNQQIVHWLREHGIDSINIDLIYGLPKQNRNTFLQTLEDTLSLHPDRLAVYSYAHLPDRLPSQKLLNEDDLPESAEKLQMMIQAIDVLSSNGYHYIGMDHFSAGGDGLSEALRAGTLQRNFQGYSTHSETDLYGFGMSSISQVGNRYYQNEKALDKYYNKLDKYELPAAKYLELNRDDQIRKSMIMRIMCQPVISFSNFSEKWDIDAKEYFKDELDQLADFEDSGLLMNTGLSLIITEKGRLFLRNIAMVFDAYLTGEISNSYSKTI